jgi:hypothetical protein
MSALANDSIRNKIKEIATRLYLLFDVPDGRKVEVYKMICEQLRYIDGGSKTWQWRYLTQVENGKMPPGARFVRAVEIYHAQLLKSEILRLVPETHIFEPGKQIPVPICPYPGCTDPHQHKHNEKTFNPATQEVFPIGEAILKGSDPALSTRKRKPDPRRRLPIRRDDAAKAAWTIVDNLPAAYVRELVQNLMIITNG